MECCSAGETPHSLEDGELPSNQSTPDSSKRSSSDQSISKEQHSTQSTSDSVQTDGKEESNSKPTEIQEQSNASTSKSDNQTDGEEQQNAESTDRKDEPAAKSAGANEPSSTESTNSKEQSIESTSKSVDQTDDCANLSTDMRKILSLEKQCSNTTDVVGTSEDKASYFCDKECMNEPGLSSICLTKGDSGSITKHEVETSGELLSDPKAETRENECNQGVTLVDLPTEVSVFGYSRIACILKSLSSVYVFYISWFPCCQVILQLCSHMDSRFLINVLRLVCRRFYCILSDEFIWRSRIMRMWTQLYPAIPSKEILLSAISESFNALV